MNRKQFHNLLSSHYQTHARSMPWRAPESDGSFDAYKILVSEMMLQQTQVSRVVPKFEAFIKTFPNIPTLSNAHQSEVLKIWSGLGYNRRAKYLKDAAQVLGTHAHPWNMELLTSCIGIGHNTAAATLVYAYNQPVSFVETNIRTVIIHHFFASHSNVPDSAILQKLESLMDTKNPRLFYWMMMDYGDHLKRTIGNAARASSQHKTQSVFKGSRREIRGKIIKLLTLQEYCPEDLLEAINDERTTALLESLVAEGLISFDDGQYRLS